MKTALVLGAGGFIRSWMVKRLKSEGYWVRGVDIKHLSSPDMIDEFVIGDLRDKSFVNRVVEYKGQLGNFFNGIPYKMIERTVKSINLPFIWAVQVISLPKNMMQISCIVLLQSI